MVLQAYSHTLKQTHTHKNTLTHTLTHSHTHTHTRTHTYTHTHAYVHTRIHTQERHLPPANVLRRVVHTLMYNSYMDGFIMAIIICNTIIMLFVSIAAHTFNVFAVNVTYVSYAAKPSSCCLWVSLHTLSSVCCECHLCILCSKTIIMLFVSIAAHTFNVFAVDITYVSYAATPPSCSLWVHYCRTRFLFATLISFLLWMSLMCHRQQNHHHALCEYRCTHFDVFAVNVTYVSYVQQNHRQALY